MSTHALLAITRRAPALRWHPATALAALVVLTSACAQQPPQSATAPKPSTADTAPQPAPGRAAGGADPLAAARAAITQTLQLACKHASDCATVGIGARACGGPEAYVPYATARTPAQPLRAAVERHAALRKQQIEMRGEMSTCELLTDPGATCSPAGQCVLQPAGRGGRNTQLF